MTAIVRREHAKSTCLTGAAGVLVLAIACVMMVLAAPSHPHAQSRGAATPAAQTLAQLTQARPAGRAALEPNAAEGPAPATRPGWAVP